MDGDVSIAKTAGFCWNLQSKFLSPKSARMPILGLEQQRS